MEFIISMPVSNVSLILCFIIIVLVVFKFYRINSSPTWKRLKVDAVKFWTNVDALLKVKLLILESFDTS